MINSLQNAKLSYVEAKDDMPTMSEVVSLNRCTPLSNTLTMDSLHDELATIISQG
jgi:hypothetical protein